MGFQSEISDALAAGLRQTMVDCQIRTFDVTDRAVLARFLEVPRELFVPTDLRGLAYSDTSLKVSEAKPGAEERRLLAPMMLARLIQAAGVRPTDRVLDVAPATGYSTAVLAGLAGHVTALESDPDLRAVTKANLNAMGLGTIDVVGGPLADGVRGAAPFDVIFINGAVEAHLEGLFAQLRDGGRLMGLCRPADAADQRAGRAMAYEKNSGEISQRALFAASAPVLAAFRAAPVFTF